MPAVAPVGLRVLLLCILRRLAFSHLCLLCELL